MAATKSSYLSDITLGREEVVRSPSLEDIAQACYELSWRKRVMVFPENISGEDTT